MNNFLKGILILVLMAGCGIVLFGVAGAEKIAEQRQAIEMVKAQGVVSQDFDNHALDTVQNVAEGGYAGIVSVAVSGDLAQTSIVKSYNTTIAFVALAIVALVGFAIYNGNKKAKENYGMGLTMYNPTSDYRSNRRLTPLELNQRPLTKEEYENTFTQNIPVNIEKPVKKQYIPEDYEW